jgi:SAM-dependent methyltransferase
MAIRMAKEQSAGTRLRFAVGDVTRLDKVKDSAFDLAVDGHCLHCITNPADRTKFFRECRRILRPGGVLVVETMARPVSRESTPGRLRGNVLYNPAPVPDVETYEGARCIGGRWCLPMRYLDRWQNILHAVEREGFEVVLLRLSAPSKESFSSTLSVAAVKR